MKKFSIIVLLFYLYTIIAWIVNLVKLLNCNFEEPWKDEIIHGIGLAPPVAWVTCWL
jgi:hypothetical protein